MNQPWVYICLLPLKPPSHLPPHPTPLGCHRAPRFELPASYSTFPLAVSLTYGDVCVSMLLSQFIPPSPSPTVSISLFCLSACPLLPCKEVHQYHPSRFHIYALKESESEVAQSCPTLCDPVDCSPPGSSVHGILQARILEWVAISFSKGSSRPRDQTQVSRTGGRCFNL